MATEPVPSYEPPRAPIQRPKSGTMDLPDNYSREMENYRVAAREEARKTQRMNAEIDRARPYLEALMGNQWGNGARRWRSKFVDNRLAKARMDHLAQLTDTRPVIDVSTQVEAYQDVAAVIGEVIRYEWSHRDLDLKLVRCADIADCYGTGFWRLGAAKPGSMSAMPCGPDQVMPIQPGWDIQESSAVLYRTWQTIQWLKAKFPYSTSGIEREITSTPIYGANYGGASDISFNRPSHIDELTWNGLAPGMKRLLGVKGAPTQETSTGQYFKTLEVEELFVDDPTTNDSINSVIVRDPFLSLEQHNWWYEVAPMARLFPRKRHIVYAGSRLLSDGPSPYWHGLYPFAMLQFNPIFSSFWGLSRYRDLLPLNQAMNEIVAACLDLIKRALNPTAITKEGAVPPAAWKEFYPDMPGYKLRVGANVALNDAMRYMDPPQIPTYVVEMLKGWLAPEFDRMSGAIDISGMSKKKQAPGGDSIEQMRDSQQTSLRLEERMLEVFLRDAGKQAASNVIQFYTADRRRQMLGAKGLTKQDFNMDLGTLFPEAKREYQKFIANFAFTISAGSLHSGSKDRNKQVAMALAGRHEIPLTELYRVLELQDPEGLFERLLKEQKAMSEAGGKPPGSGGGASRTSRGQRQGKSV